jgi:small multidrug resistance pump
MKMTSSTVFYFLTFWAMQVGAVLLFTYGGRYPEHSLKALLIGNAIAVPSIYFLMKLYGLMNVNVAYGVAIGGAFLIAQVMIALVFRSPLSSLQWAGIVGMCGSMLLLALK